MSTDVADALDLADQLDQPDQPLPGMPAAPEVEPEPEPKRPRAGRKPRTPRAPGKTPPKPGAPRSATRRPALGPRVAQAHQLLGVGITMAPVPNAQAVGTALLLQADSIGQSWEQLAKENPRVREILESLLTASAVGGLLMAYLPVVLAAGGKGGPLADLMAGAGLLADPMPGPLHVVTPAP